MQNAILGIIVGASFVVLTLAAVLSRRTRPGAIGLQLAMGVIVGGLAAATAVSVRADLVPDNIEAFIAVVAVLLVGVALLVIMVRHQTR